MRMRFSGEYIELKLKTFIKITEDDLREFYDKNRKEFGKAEFDDAREKIEEYLVEKEVNIKAEKAYRRLKVKGVYKDSIG